MNMTRSAHPVIRVLLIEHDESSGIRQLLIDSQRPRFEIEAARDVSSSLEALMSAEFDLVLLDLDLPDGSGIEALTSVAAYVPRVPVVVVTAKDDDSLATRVLREGAEDCLVRSQINSGLLTRALRYAVERHETEAKLRDAMEELQHAGKMEAMGRLAGGVAHDFNNALTTISGYASLLSESFGEGDHREGEVHEIVKAVDHATSLTRQLLVFSRKEACKPQLLDLNDVVAETGAMLRPLLGEDVELIAHEGRSLRNVMAERTAMEQIIVNLAINGRDAMPSGGILTIDVCNQRMTEELLPRTRDLKAGSYVQLSVTDTGVGIPPDVIEHIFEPFFTTKEPTKGTGLGLSTVYGLVQQNGGHIGVYSELGLGTCFKVFLPGVDGVADEREDLRQNLSQLKGTETLLVVEDDPGLLTMVRSFLEKMDYNLLLASNGKKALERSHEYDGEIDLVLCDVVLPDLGGPQIVDQLRGARPDMKAIYMSAYTREAMRDRGLLLSNMEFISKPFTIEDVGQKIRDVLT